MGKLAEHQLRQIDEMRRLGPREAQDRITGTIALARLAGAGDAEGLSSELRARPDADPSLALRWAAENGHAECLVLAMEAAGAEPFDPAAAILAALAGHAPCLSLLARKAPYSDSLADPLRAACAANQPGCVQVLLGLPGGPEPDCPLARCSDPGVLGAKSPLDWCVHSGSAACEKLLLAELCRRDPQRALPLCARHGYADLVRSLIPRCDPGHAGSEALYEAAANGRLDCAKLLIPVSEPTDQDSRAMRFAAMNGHADCLALLIPLSEPAALGFHALRSACEEGRAECVRLLLGAERPTGKTAAACLRRAIISLDADCVFEAASFLLPAAEKEPGMPPLHIAMHLNYDEDYIVEPRSGEVIRALMRAGAAMLPDDQGRGPIEFARAHLGPEARELVENAFAAAFAEREAGAIGAAAREPSSHLTTQPAIGRPPPRMPAASRGGRMERRTSSCPTPARLHPNSTPTPPQLHPNSTPTPPQPSTRLLSPPDAASQPMTFAHAIDPREMTALLCGAAHAARRALSSKVNAPPLIHIMDKALGGADGSPPDPHAPRSSFQTKIVRSNLVHMEHPSYALLLSPPSGVYARLVDWSSPGATALAAEAADDCGRAYGQALLDSGLFDPALCAEAANSAREGFAFAMAQALARQSPATAPVGASERAAFEALTSQVGAHASMADKAALRDSLAGLHPSQAARLMQQSRVAFGAPPFTAKDDVPHYRLRKGGSHPSKPAALERWLGIHMAKAVASPSFDLGIQAAYLAPLLHTPDGPIEGACEIKAWGMAVLARTESFELASCAPSAPASARRRLGL